MAKKLKNLDLQEISLVTDPANPSARVVVHKRRRTPRTPSYNTTEDVSWGDVDKSLEAFIRGYYDQQGETPPDELPDTVEDLTPDMRSWIAGKTLLGEEDAETADELISYPVVNPATNNLNRNALVAAKSYAARSTMAEDTIEAVQGKADTLLEEFDKMNKSTGNSQNLSKARDRIAEVLKGVMTGEDQRNFDDALKEELQWQRSIEIREKMMPMVDALRESVQASVMELSGDARDQRIRDNVESFLEAVQEALDESDNGGNNNGNSDNGGSDTMNYSKANQAGTDQGNQGGAGEQETVETMKARMDALTKAVEGAGFTVEENGGEFKIAKAADDEKTTCPDGTEVFKSQVGESQFRILKAQNDEIQKLRAEREREELAKEAENRWPNVAGGRDQKADILKSLKGIDNQEARDAALGYIDSLNETMADMMVEKGNSGNGSAGSEPMEKINTLAKERVDKTGETFEQAFSEVLKTDQGSKLYDDYLASRSG